MFCSFCGAKLAENVKFCSQCGAAIEGAVPQNQPETSAPQPSAESQADVYQPSYGEQAYEGFYPAQAIAPPDPKKKVAKVAATILTVIAVLLYLFQLLGILGSGFDGFAYTIAISEMMDALNGAIYIISYFIGYFIFAIIATVLMTIAYGLRKYSKK